MTHRREFLALLAAGLAGPGGPILAGAPDDSPVDCHTHFYDPSRPEGVPWPPKDDQVLYRTVLPEHFLAEAQPVGVRRTVVVEASPRVEDNAWLLDLAKGNSSIVGVVGNLAPGAPEFAERLGRFGANRIFRGIRVGQDAVRRGWERAEFLRDMERLAERDLELDVNGGPETPTDVARLATKVPSLRIVINHLANIDLDGGPPPRAWVDAMRDAARNERVFCKVSALVEHAKAKANGDRVKSGKPQVPEDVEFYRPVLDAIWDAFGEDRLIYGSNWPVSDRFAPYRVVHAIVRAYVEGRGARAAAKYFFRNSLTAYRYSQ